MPRRPKLPPMPSGDARSFSAIPRIEAKVDELKARVDEHEERLGDAEDLLTEHQGLLEAVEKDLLTLRALGERLAQRERDREHAQLVRRRRSRPRSD